MKPKVSIVIPCYNVELYLRQCLDSVVNQTLKEIEIICIDDGSTDGTLAVLEEYAQNDERIILVKQKNIGVATTRNNAIKNSTGDFIIFCDADDYYPTPDILETLYTKAIENNVLICGGEFSEFTNDNKKLQQNFPDSVVNGYLFDKEGIIDYKDYQFDYGFHRFIYNREFLLKNDIFYPIYKRFEDPPFFVNAMIQAKQFYAIDKIVYAYRIAHKQDKIDIKYVNDLLNGLINNFTFAKEYNLIKLHNYTKTRFFEHFELIINSFNIQSLSLLKKIESYCPEINFKKIVKKYFQLKLQNIFSLKNKDKHKIITILGFKIKLKREKYAKI